ncbi:group I truncated hemoglobin [Streptomyces olivaceoviridis]|uniref:group I truncated hemoglobin n=1 Tax=Streptomyces olivaceoviridis TaxID=1921 RepID=UPI003D9F9D6A
MTESAQAPSLYERLGGTMGIAAVMDVLTDRLYDNVSANRNPYAQKLHETNSRAGFKFMVTAWSIQETGGPKCYPGRDMREAHADMVATEEDFDIVALEIAATLSAAHQGMERDRGGGGRGRPRHPGVTTSATRPRSRTRSTTSTRSGTTSRSDSSRTAEWPPAPGRCSSSSRS